MASPENNIYIGLRGNQVLRGNPESIVIFQISCTISKLQGF